MDFTKTCTDKQFDLAIVDPPYGINIAKEKPRISGRWNYKPKQWDSAIPKQEYFDELFRVSKKQIIWGGNYFHLPPSRCWIIWDKQQSVDNYSDGEMAWTNYDEVVSFFRFSFSANKNKIHITQKPIALYKWCLSHYAHPGYKLLDTHSGSGSFRIAAYDMGFDLVSCEIDGDYCHDNEACYQEHIAQQELIPVEEIQQLTFRDKVC